MSRLFFVAAFAAGLLAQSESVLEQADAAFRQGDLDRAAMLARHALTREAGCRLQWFNTACFQQTAFGVWGNSPIGDYEDPGIANVNLAILRSFKLPLESSSLDFRADFFNALNHTQWGPSIPSFTNVNYGRITSTRAPRQSQLSLTFRF